MAFHPLSSLLRAYSIVSLTCLGQCRRLSKEKLVHDLSTAERTQTNTALAGFVCPEECLECCRSGSDHFKCILQKPYGAATKPISHDCGDVQQRTAKGQEYQAKVKCKYNDGDKESLKDATNELNAQCSKVSRCCCDSRGIGVCIGNRYHETRLHRMFAPSVGVSTESFFRFLPEKRLTLNMWNTCPAGFSDWSDGQDTPCECAQACGNTWAPGGWAPEKRAKEDSDDWKQYLSLASGVYVGEPLVSGWKLEVLWNTMDGKSWAGLKGLDYVGIYRRIEGETKKCSLAFAGTDDLMNVGADILGWMRYASKWCGFEGVHASFANYMRAFMIKGSKFEDFVKFLSDPNECTVGHRFVLGHSLGGALASLLAACANRPEANATLTDKVNLFNKDFKFDGLYTFGAAATSTRMLTNRHTSNGCFPGGRFWLTKKDNRIRFGSKRKIDLIPNIGSWRMPSSLRHPRMDSIAVEENVGKDGKSAFTYKVFKCDDRTPETEKSMSNATFKQLQAPWGRSGLWKGKISEYHNTKDYWASMQHMDPVANLVVTTVATK